MTSKSPLYFFSTPIRAKTHLTKYGIVRLRGRLRHTSNAMRPPISQAYTLGGRLLVLFTVVLVAVMPWTEYFCQLDKFLRGGQDCELGLLCLLTTLSLVLVLLNQRRQNVVLLLTVRRWLSLVFEAPDPRDSAPCSLIADSGSVALFTQSLCRYNLPLQV